jgi:hypothetical protein
MQVADGRFVRSKDIRIVCHSKLGDSTISGAYSFPIIDKLMAKRIDK